MASTLDIVIVVILIIGIVRGCMRGIVKQAGSLVGMIAGLVIARLFAPTVLEPLLRSMFDIPEAIYTPLSYLITFLIVLWGVQLLALLLQKILEKIKLGAVNRVAGALFSLYRYALIVSIVLNVILILDTNNQCLSSETKETSILYPIVQPIAPALLSTIEKGVGTEIEYIKAKNNITAQQQTSVPLVSYIYPKNER